MTFHSNTKPGAVLFNFWRVDSFTAYLFTLVTITLLCFLKEYITSVRLKRQAAAAANQPTRQPLLGSGSRGRAGSTVARLLADDKAVESALYAASSLLGLWIMLIAMTFEIGFFVTIILASAVAHYVFTDTRHAMAPETECCEG